MKALVALVSVLVTITIVWKMSVLLLPKWTTTSTNTANAQMVCGHRPEIVSELETKYGETQQSFGLQPDRGIVETYANLETGSWTVIITTTNGRSCLVALGTNFTITKANGKEA